MIFLASLLERSSRAASCEMPRASLHELFQSEEGMWTQKGLDTACINLVYRVNQDVLLKGYTNSSEQKNNAEETMGSCVTRLP